MRLKSWYSDGHNVETTHVELVDNGKRLARWRKRPRLFEQAVQTWHKDAACRNADPALFHQEIPQYPSQSDDFDDAVTKTRLAIAICSRCSVVDECAVSRLENDSPGVWAGALWKPTNNNAPMIIDERFVA